MPQTDVFLPHLAVTTLTELLDQLFASWQLLPAETRAAVDEQRLAVAERLPAASEYGRIGQIVALLEWMEEQGAVVAVAAEVLRAGRGPAMRSIESLPDAQIQEVVDLLRTPAPAIETVDNGQPAEIPVEFYVGVEFPPEVEIGADQHLIVQLLRNPPDSGALRNKVVVNFRDLQTPVPLEVVLNAPGFTETTGVSSRTINVFAHEDSLAAVFLLRSEDKTGPKRLSVDFYHAVGAIGQQTEITVPSETTYRSFRSNESFSIPSGVKSIGVPDKPEVSVQFFTNVEFPGKIQRGAVRPLIVQLTLEQIEESLTHESFHVGFADVRRPELIEVVLNASHFEEITGAGQRLMRLYSDADSQPAVFLLQAGDQVGPANIRIDFYHRGRMLGSATFQPEITVDAVEEPPPLTATGPAVIFDSIPTNPPPPPDLELRITYDPDDKTLAFQLHSTRADVPYHWKSVGKTTLDAASPEQHLEHQFERLSQLAAQPVDDLAADRALVSIREMESIGQKLFQLFPAELKAEYWGRITKLRDQGLVRTLLITSDEPWIPWEMVKPFEYDSITDEDKEDGFLAETFQICRWLAGNGPSDGVEVRAAKVVVPKLDLPAAKQEQDYFCNTLVQEKQTEVGALQMLHELLDVIESGDFQILHFAAHGRFDATNPDASPLTLQDGELKPEQLSNRTIRQFRRQKPLVFLNACHTGRVAFALTQLGGWAEKWVNDVRVSAFVGTMWEVHDELAADFAEHFYNGLLAEKTLSEALFDARMEIRARQPANPTWLAYTLYSDPNGVVSWGES